MHQLGRFVVCCLVFLGLAAAGLYMLGGKQYEFASSADIEASPQLVYATLATIEPSQAGYVGPVRTELANELVLELPDQWQSFRTKSNLYDALTAIQVSPTDNGSRLQQVTYVEYKGVYRILAPLVSSQSQQAADENLQDIADAVSGNH